MISDTTPSCCQTLRSRALREWRVFDLPVRWFLLISIVFFSFLLSVPAFAQDEDLRVLEAERLEIFDAINALRDEYSLDTMIIDSNLTAAAQRQAEYLSSIGKLSSEGPAHESLRIRAEDAGYGGGGLFSIEENQARVWTETKGDYIVNNIWKIEQKSVRNMMTAELRHVGIGISDASNKRRYVVAMFGALEDGGDDYEVQSTYDFRTPKPLISSTPTLYPLITTTPHEDGGIYHTVHEGETFSEIALAYGLDWTTLSELNYLNIQTEVVVYEGQELVIQRTFTLTPTPTPSRTPRPDTSTPRPTYTIDVNAPMETQEAALHPTEPAPSERAESLLHKLAGYKAAVGIFLIILCVLGLLLLFIRKE